MYTKKIDETLREIVRIVVSVGKTVSVIQLELVYLYQLLKFVYFYTRFDL